MKLKEYIKSTIDEVSSDLKENNKRKRELKLAKNKAEHEVELKAQKKFAEEKLKIKHKKELANIKEGKKKEGFFSSDYFKGVAENFDRESKKESLLGELELGGKQNGKEKEHRKEGKEVPKERPEIIW